MSVVTDHNKSERKIIHFNIKYVAFFFFFKGYRNKSFSYAVTLRNLIHSYACMPQKLASMQMNVDDNDNIALILHTLHINCTSLFEILPL